MRNFTIMENRNRGVAGGALEPTVFKNIKMGEVIALLYDDSSYPEENLMI